LLYGKTPFSLGLENFQTLDREKLLDVQSDKILNDSLHFPAEKQISPKLKNIVSGCLAKDPRIRLTAEKALNLLLEKTDARYEFAISHRLAMRPVLPKVLYEDMEVPEEPILRQPTVNDRSDQSITISKDHKSFIIHGSLRDIPVSVPGLQKRSRSPRDNRGDESSSGKDFILFKREAGYNTRRHATHHQDDHHFTPGETKTPQFLGKVKMSQRLSTINNLKPEDIGMGSQKSNDKKLNSNLLDHGGMDLESLGKSDEQNSFELLPDKGRGFFDFFFNNNFKKEYKTIEDKQSSLKSIPLMKSTVVKDGFVPSPTKVSSSIWSMRNPSSIKNLDNLTEKNTIDWKPRMTSVQKPVKPGSMESMDNSPQLTPVKPQSIGPSTPQKINQQNAFSPKVQFFRQNYQL
jgi:hypothetical protein